MVRKTKATAPSKSNGGRPKRYRPSWPLNKPERQFWKKLMGTKAGQEYYFLHEEYRRLKMAWAEVMVMTELTEKEVQQLQQHHSDLLRLYFDGLSRMVLLGLCTLGDGVKQDRSFDARAPSISLPAWIARYGGGPHDVPASLLKAVNRFIAVHAPIRELRNKVLAHADMRYVLNDQRSGISWATVEEAFRAVEAFFRAVETQFGVPFHADIPPMNLQGIRSLVQQVGS